MRKKSFKSALTVLLSLMMILVMFPANAFAMDGEGTKENPYEIATAEELFEFAAAVNGGNTAACAVLTADITLPIDTNWTPIGKENACMYEGTFDGRATPSPGCIAASAAAMSPAYSASSAAAAW